MEHHIGLTGYIEQLVDLAEHIVHLVDLAEHIVHLVDLAEHVVHLVEHFFGLAGHVIQTFSQHLVDILKSSQFVDF